jgi:hypothetical protein
MTVLDKFVSFAKALPAEQLEAVEASLAEIMESMSDDSDFTPEELAELDRRMADPNPRMADDAAVERLLGRPLPGR